MRKEDLLSPGRIRHRWLLLSRSSARVKGQWLWDCECACGRQKQIAHFNLLKGKSKSCGCYRADFNRARVGPRSPTWKTGRTTTEHGYIRVRAKHTGGRSQELEHRLVMEQRLGRKLFPFETVHHKNGDRSDNRLENLELWASAHCRGQRVEDLVSWAKQVLLIYGDKL